MKDIFGVRARGPWAVVATLICLSLFAQSAWAVVDYTRSIGADFQATYPGGIHNATGDQAPVGNPFGPNSEWEFHGVNGLASDLVSVGSGIHGPGLPASGQAGWRESTLTNGTWTYFAQQFQPGVTVNPRVNGHGPQEALWTAPASVDEGGISISGSIEQLFEPNREMRLSIYKNASATPFFSVDALPPIVNGVLLQRVDFGPVDVAIQPGDTLLMTVFPSNDPPPSQAHIPTFAAWNLTFTEFVIPEPASMMLLMFGAIAVGMADFRRRRCA
ncbi:MAG: PEP-CTERM sorting domain-containing protein [Pirellulales bacterium]